MGSAISGGANPNALHDLYQSHGSHGQSGHKPYSGGSETVGHKSILSESKVKLILEIAKTLSGLLDLKSVSLTKENIDKVVDELKNKLQIVRKIKPDKCEKVSKTFAQAINHAYGTVLIPLSDSPKEICEKVGQILRSLFEGLKAEYQGVHVDVTRILQNFDFLIQYLQESQTELIRRLAESSATYSKDDEDMMRRKYDLIFEELRRNKVILQNLLDSTVNPTQAALSSMMADNPDFAGIVENLKNLSPDVAVGENLSRSIVGMVGIADAAYKVYKSMMKLGITIDDLKKRPQFAELREFLLEKVRQNGTKDSKSMLEQLTVVQSLLNNMVFDSERMADYIREHEKEIKQQIGAAARGGRYLVDEITEQTMDNDTPFAGRTQMRRKSIVKKVADNNKLLDIAFEGLHRTFREEMMKLKSTFAPIGPRIGKEIPVSLDLDFFDRQLLKFRNSLPEKKDMYKTLTAYFTDIGSTRSKFIFVENLYGIMAAIEPLVNKPGGQFFRPVQAAIVAMVKSIDNFNKTFGQIYNVLPPDLSSLKSKEAISIGGADSDDERVSGGSVDGGALVDIISRYKPADFKYFQTMAKTIRQFDYYYRIANIRDNVVKMSGELEGYTVNYVNVLGEEAGYMIDQVVSRYNGIIADLEKEDGTDGVHHSILGTSTSKHYDQNFPEFKQSLGSNLKSAAFASTKDAKSEIQASYKLIMEFKKNACIGLIEAAQSLDLYLSGFTKILQKNPDNLKSIVQILEQLELTAKFFTDRSGDLLATIFESFPYNEERAATDGIFTYKVRSDLSNSSEMKPSGADYFKKMYNESLEDPNLSKVGSGYLHRLMNVDQMKNFLKLIENTVRSNQALANIIELFHNLTLNNEMIVAPMKPGQMMIAFMRYAISSYIAVGFEDLYADKHTGDLYPATHRLCAIEDKVVNYNSYTVNGPTKSQLHEWAVFHKCSIGLKFVAKNMCFIHNIDNISKRSIIFTSGPKPTNRYYLQQIDLFENSLAASSVVMNSLQDLYVSSLKAIAGKICTIISSYTLFHRPPRDMGSLDNLALASNPIRQIFGGAVLPSSVIVKVIPDASDLYIRLPLLAEWYREVLKFSRENKDGLADNGLLISMIPQMDGVWYDLVRVIFIDGGRIQDGGYPAEYANRIILAVNKIYETYQPKKLSNRDIVQEFVKEVNRRFGFVVRREIDSYFKAMDKDIIENRAEVDEEESNDYGLLETEYAGRAALPSDRYRKTPAKSATKKKAEWKAFNNAVNDFRSSVEANLIIEQVAGSLNVADDIKLDRDVDQISLTNMIDMVRSRIKKAPSDEARYRIVVELMQGVDKFGDVDFNKMIMFHETITFPLTVLYFIYQKINSFNNWFTMMAVDPEKLDKWLSVKSNSDAVDAAYKKAKIAQMAKNTKEVNAVFAEPNTNAFNLSKAILLKVNEANFKNVTNNPYKLLNNEKYFETACNIIYGAIGEKFNNPILDELFPTLLRDISVENAAYSVENYAVYSHKGGVHPVNLFVSYAVADSANKRPVMEMMLDHQFLMRTSMEFLMDMAADLNGLTEVYFSGESKIRYPTVNFDKLANICTSIFDKVKHNFVELRKYLPSSLTQPYEKLEDGPNIFFIEENLINRLINNKFGNGLVDANEGLKNTWNFLTRERKYNVIHLKDDPAGAAQCLVEKFEKSADFKTNGKIPTGFHGLERDAHYVSYDRILSELCYWFPAVDKVESRDYPPINVSETLQEFPFYYSPLLKNNNALSNSSRDKFPKGSPNFTAAGEPLSKDFLNSFKDSALIKADVSGKQMMYYGDPSLYKYDLSVLRGAYADSAETLLNIGRTAPIFGGADEIKSVDDIDPFKFVTIANNLIKELTKIRYSSDKIYNGLKIFHTIRLCDNIISCVLAYAKTVGSAIVALEKQGTGKMDTNDKRLIEHIKRINLIVSSIFEFSCNIMAGLTNFATLASPYSDIVIDGLAVKVIDDALSVYNRDVVRKILIPLLNELYAVPKKVIEDSKIDTVDFNIKMSNGTVFYVMLDYNKVIGYISPASDAELSPLELNEKYGSSENYTDFHYLVQADKLLVEEKYDDVLRSSTALSESEKKQISIFYNTRKGLITSLENNLIPEKLEEFSDKDSPSEDEFKGMEYLGEIITYINPDLVGMVNSTINEKRKNLKEPEKKEPEKKEPEKKEAATLIFPTKEIQSAFDETKKSPHFTSDVETKFFDLFSTISINKFESEIKNHTATTIGFTIDTIRDNSSMPITADKIKELTTKINSDDYSIILQVVAKSVFDLNMLFCYISDKEEQKKHEDNFFWNVVDEKEIQEIVDKYIKQYGTVAPPSSKAPSLKTVKAKFMSASVVAAVSKLANILRKPIYKDHNMHKDKMIISSTGRIRGGFTDYAADTVYSDVPNGFYIPAIRLGLVPEINNILFRLINTFLDGSKHKIYKKLINGITTGYNAKEIFKGHAINDNVFYSSKFKSSQITDPTKSYSYFSTYYQNATSMLDPPQNATLFASLAAGIRGLATLANEKLTGTVLAHIEEDMANIGDYQKELMRAYLPSFEKEVAIVLRKANFLKAVIESTRCKTYRNYTSTVKPSFIRNNEAIKDFAIPGSFPTIENETARKSYLLSMLNGVTLTANGIQKSILDTQKDLADIPLYFETYQNSISDYNNRNNALPFMPLSHLSHLFNITNFFTGEDKYGFNKEHTVYNPFLGSANRTIGTDSFKFAYGTRGILNYRQSPNIDIAPGVLQLVDNYNAKAGGARRVEKSEYTGLFKELVMLSRFIIDQKYLVRHDNQGRWLYDQFKQIVDIQAKPNVRAIAACQTGLRAIDQPFWGTPANIIMMTENDNIRQTVYRFISTIQAPKENKLFNTERKRLRVYNIHDLNIVPVNIHALQREMPFVNIINYGYTFDHISKQNMSSTLRRDTMADLKSGLLKNFDPSTLQISMVSDVGNDSKTCENLIRKSMSPYTGIVLPDAIFAKRLHNLFATARPGINKKNLENLAHFDLENSQAEADKISVNGTAYQNISRSSLIRDNIPVEDSIMLFMLEPFAHHFAQDYFKYMVEMAKGYSKYFDGVPKYISDQLVSKVLLLGFDVAARPSNKNMLNSGSAGVNRGIVFRHDSSNKVVVPAKSNIADPAILGICEPATNLKIYDYDCTIEKLTGTAIVSIDGILRPGFKNGMQIGSVFTVSNKKENPIEMIVNFDEDTTGFHHPAGVTAANFNMQSYLRYSTTIIRDQLFHVNLQRFIRHLIADQLDWSANPVVRDRDVVNESVTEFSKNEKFDPDVFN